MGRLKNTVLRWLGQRSFDDLVAAYDQALEQRSLCAHTIACRRITMRQLSGSFGGVLLRDIYPHHIAAAIRREADRGHPSNANTMLRVMRAMCYEAISMGWMDRNPALLIRPVPAPVQRQRMSLEQWRAILEQASPRMPVWFPHMWRLALVSGQRCADLAGMRFDWVRDGHLFIEQQKTGARVALPLALRLDAVGLALGEVIEDCRRYGKPGDHLIRSPQGWRPIQPKTLSRQCHVARGIAGVTVEQGTPPSLHEVRSLAERLYRQQGIDTRILLGHKHQRMTDKYNDDRGLDAKKWMVLPLPSTPPHTDQPP